MKKADLIDEYDVLRRLGVDVNDPVVRDWWVEFERYLTRTTLPGGWRRLYDWQEVFDQAVIEMPNDPDRKPLPLRRPAPTLTLVSDGGNRPAPPDPLRKAKRG